MESLNQPVAGVRPFYVRVSDAKLDQVMSRVRDFRFPVRVEMAEWEQGVSYPFMEQLVDHWRTVYNWRRFEADLNAHLQFVADINGHTIHFYHVLGKGPNPTPLLLTHGWPGSVIEYLYLIEKLTDPVKFGGSVDDSFTVVVPSLPGYGFSSHPLQPVGPVTTAGLLHKLMTKVLGYEKFASHAGDLGGLMQVQLASRYPASLIGVHFLNIATNPELDGKLNEEEKEWQAKSAAFLQAEMSYFPQQMLKSNTVAFALADNPVGTAAWLVEKIYAWSDHRGHFSRLFSNDLLLNMVMMYLLTDTASSAMTYYGAIPLETNWLFHPGPRIGVPTGVLNLPADYVNQHPPRSLAERSYNITRWSTLPNGGHYAGLEVPDGLVADIREFIRAAKLVA